MDGSIAPARSFSVSISSIEEPPALGVPEEIVPGILWLRLPLPYVFDHINLYLFEERDGWAVWDTGIGNDECRAIWQSVLQSHLGGRLTRIIGSHFHPDHVGLAGWLHDRCGAPLHMTAGEYLLGRMQQAETGPAATAAEQENYRRLGLPAQEIAEIPSRASEYSGLTARLPAQFERLKEGQMLDLGGRSWQVLTGSGHTTELVMLWCAADGILLSSDQVLPTIAPGVGISATEPNGNPLDDYLTSLDRLRQQIPEDVLVLPSHYLPFYGLHQRIYELEQHHRARAELIAGRCAASGALTAADVTKTLFRRKLCPAPFSYAAEATMAHLHHLVAADRITAMPREGGATLFGAR